MVSAIGTKMDSLVYLEGCKVDDTVDVGVSCEDLAQGLLVGDVDLIEGWSFPADQLDAVQSYLRGVVEVIDNDYFIAMFEQGQSRERPNIASASVNGVVRDFVYCGYAWRGRKPSPTMAQTSMKL
jgi:hypothetical protein